MRKPQEGPAHPTSRCGGSGVWEYYTDCGVGAWDSSHLAFGVASVRAALYEQRARGSSWFVLGRAPQRWTLNALSLPGLPASPDHLPSQAQATSSRAFPAAPALRLLLPPTYDLLRHLGHAQPGGTHGSPAQPTHQSFIRVPWFPVDPFPRKGSVVLSLTGLVYGQALARGQGCGHFMSRTNGDPVAEVSGQSHMAWVTAGGCQLHASPSGSPVQSLMTREAEHWGPGLGTQSGHMGALTNVGQGYLGLGLPSDRCAHPLQLVLQWHQPHPGPAAAPVPSQRSGRLPHPAQ